MRAGAPRTFFTVKYKSIFTALIVLTVVIAAFAVLPLPKVEAGTPYPNFSIMSWSLTSGSIEAFSYCSSASVGQWPTLCTVSGSPNAAPSAVVGTISVSIPSAGTFVLIAVEQTCGAVNTAAPIVSDSMSSKWTDLTSWNISASGGTTIWLGVNFIYAYVMQSGGDSITITGSSSCAGGIEVYYAQGFSLGSVIFTSPQGSTAAVSAQSSSVAIASSITNSFSVSSSNYYLTVFGFTGTTPYRTPYCGPLQYYDFCTQYQTPAYQQQSASYSYTGTVAPNSCTAASGSYCAVGYLIFAVAFTSNPAYSQGKQYIGNQAPITSGATLAQSSYVLSNAEQGTTATGSSLYIPFQPPSYWNQLTISNITVWLWGVKCAASGTPPTCTQSTFPVTIGLWYQQPNIAIPPTSSQPATALTADSCTYNLNNGTFAKPQQFTCSFPSPVNFYSTNGPYAIFLVVSFTGSGTSPSYLYIDTSSAQNYQPYLDNCASDGYNSYYIRCGTLQSAYPAIYTSVAFQTAGTLTFTTSVFTSYTATVTSTTSSTSTISIISSTTQTVQTTYTQVINQVLNFPNINTFQFWWFPLTIWLIFIGLFAALGRAANADGKTMILLILLGLEFGSIAGALMGTTPFIFSVIFAAMLGVVLWKVH